MIQYIDAALLFNLVANIIYVTPALRDSLNGSRTEEV